MKKILFYMGIGSIYAVFTIALFLALNYFNPLGLNEQHPQISQAPSTCPPIHKMKFGVEILKFLVWEEPEVEPRLHMLVPLNITGMSGKIIELREIQKKARKGK